MVAQSGEVVFRSPSGREYVSVPPPLPLERDPVQGVADEYPGVGAGSNACGWDGETPDYADCIDGILRLDGAAE